MDVDVSGFDELLKRLKQISNTDGLEKKTLEAGAAETKKVLEAAAPVRSGVLKGNIITTDIMNGAIEIGTKPTGDGFYGFFLEFGTSKLTARPWARPAFERSKNTIKGIMAAELKRGMGL